jgi:putative membrane protein
MLWPTVIAVIWGIGLSVSGISPYDRTTWAMEVAPCVIVLPLLLGTARRAPLTPLLYALILLHGLVLIVGGAYSYARVPAGFLVQDFFDLSRNPYDKLGHFMQGMVPAITARELLLRWGGLRRGGWLVAVVILSCLGISAIYEIVEWAAALALGQGATEFLGTQGYEWDTQSDMFLCGIGAIAALSLLGRWHDRLLARLPSDARSPV